MSTATLVRWSGVVAMVGGVLFPVAAIIHPAGESLAAVNTPNWVPAHLVGWVSVTFMHLGLVGLYVRQVDEAGWLGLCGFVLAFAGGAFAGSVQYVTSTAIPLIAARAPALFEQAMTPPVFAPPLFILGFVFGHILFGVSTMHAGILPRASGMLVIIGMLLFFLGEISFFGQRVSSPSLLQLLYVIRRLRPIILLGDAAFGLGFAWMGYAVWSKKLSLRTVLADS